MKHSILIGKGETRQWLDLGYANRHGLIAGATGTGKTVSLQVLAEGFSHAGVPVFAADVKGDLSGISQAGREHPKIQERLDIIGIEDFAFGGCPTVCWDVYGAQGHPVRVTISDMGPLLLARLMRLSEAQEGVLQIAFSVADDEGLLLLDLKDLRAMVQFVGEHAKELAHEYGHVHSASVGAIQRRLLQLEEAGADELFGEPAMEMSDLLRTDMQGRGLIHLLAAEKLIRSPRLYAAFLLWLLSELFETLPEVGDPEKPKLVLFFDEAHLLFDDAPKVLLEKIEQVVRLIRSKGVGVYFVTQSPQDLPVDVLGQLGNRVQHALRAFTPKDAKAVKVAAQTFRPNPAFDTAEIITQLGVGEALVSTLQEDGIPSVVDRTLICPPRSRIGPADEGERKALLAHSPVAGKYDADIDRDSAYEMLQRRAEQAARNAEQRAAREAEVERMADAEDDARAQETPRKRRSGGRKRQGYGEALIKSVLRTIGNHLGRQIVRGILGSLKR